jgi:hypothetical protein
MQTTVLKSITATHTQVITVARAELLSTANSTKWVPFHTNLLVFSSQADIQLDSLTNQLLHVTSLNWTAENWQLQLTLLRKHRFHCYSPTIPLSLYAYLLPEAPVYQTVT